MPSVLDMLVVDGKQYGIPMQYNLVYLFWNKTLFAEAGLDPDVPPETWEEAMEFAVKLTDPRKNQYGFGLPTKTAPLYWLSLFWGYGGEVFDTQTLEARINSPENIAALKVVQDAVVNHRVSPRNTTGPELDNMFWAERVAMLVNGPWVINGLRGSRYRLRRGCSSPGDPCGTRCPWILWDSTFPHQPAKRRNRLSTSSLSTGTPQK